MSAELLQRLAEAGTPLTLVMEVAEALADARAAERLLQARREKDAARQQDKRDRDKADHHVMSRDTADIADVTPEIPSPQSPPLKVPPDPLKITPPLTPQPDGRNARATATRLPEDWKPSKLNRDTVSGQIVENRGQEWARRALESFKNHWRSANGPNARKRDWQATFANWIIEQDNRDGRSNTLGRHQSADGISSTARAAIAVFGSDPGDGRGVPQ